MTKAESLSFPRDQTGVWRRRYLSAAIRRRVPGTGDNGTAVAGHGDLSLARCK